MYFDLQVKNRYNCNLENMDTYVGPFTADDDKKIVEGVRKYGRNYSKIAKEINRSRLSVRHRYWVLKQWIEKHPDEDLSKVPRRHQLNFIKYQLQQQTKIRSIAEKFIKNGEGIPTLQMIKNAVKKKVVKKHPKMVKKVAGTVHDRLLHFFRSSYNPPARSEVTSEDTARQSAGVIHDVLKVLGANLEIPDDATLENSLNLEKDDACILKCIREQQNAAGTSTEPVKWLIPPNVETVLGLRGLIVKNSADKNKTLNKDADLNADLRGLDVTTRAHALHDRDLFQQRIYSLFTWPSVLSVTEPSEAVKSALVKEAPTVKLVVKKSIGRPTKYVKKNLAKVEKMLMARKVVKDLKQTPKAEGKPSIRVKRFADCSNFSKREGLRPRAAKEGPELVPECTVTTLRQVDFAEVQKAMAQKKKPKIFVIANDESGEGQQSNAVKITGEIYLKKCVCVNAGASTSKEPETIIIDDEDVVSNGTSVDQSQSPASVSCVDKAQNGLQDTSFASDDSLSLTVNSKSVRTYKRKRKVETSGLEKHSKVSATGSVKVESEMESLERDISILDSILHSDRKCS